MAMTIPVLFDFYRSPDRMSVNPALEEEHDCDEQKRCTDHQDIERTH